MPTTRRDFLAELTLGAGTVLMTPPPRAVGDEPPPPQDDPSAWTIFITNDTCPDYTWGYDEAQTRRNFAELVRTHLDLMTTTDGDAPSNRDRYNMAVTMEALCFLERYPEREQELARRVREGRVCISPFLCNSLWGFQGVEGFLRTFYPARRLERRWGVTFDVAEHIELPSLPWGVATLLTGCGVRWLSVSFYDYDSAFNGLTCPPLFLFEGPDGSKVRVVMDAWASRKANYVQGGKLLSKPEAIETEWTSHYRRLGSAYPARAFLASGTHGDTGPGSAAQAAGFAARIKAYNQRPGPHPTLVNATLSGFCKAIDEVEERTSFLPTVRGCFGHSWELWTVSLARLVADLREGERSFLTAEAMVAVASRAEPGVVASTRAARERAEWCLAMLSDHAWNGTDDTNRRENARLRREWGQDLNDLARDIRSRAWSALGITPGDRNITVFNGLSIPRADLIRLEAPERAGVLTDGETPLESQIVMEEGKRIFYGVTPTVPGFGLKSYQWGPGSDTRPDKGIGLNPWELESPFYRLRVDPKTGGLASLVHRGTGAELVAAGDGRTLCQTTYFDEKEQPVTGVTPEVVTSGPVLSRLRIDATTAGVKVRTFVTVYQKLDRVDFDVRIIRPVGRRRERLCQVFPVRHPGSTLQVETTGAVIRPTRQPDGDMLPGADIRRLAVQGFVEFSTPSGPTVTISPLDCFALRLDLGQITFEALGSDQNEKEVTHDQGGVTDFRFRYVLRAPAEGAEAGSSLAWSRVVGNPLVFVVGRVSPESLAGQSVLIDPLRAVATCLKPADDEQAGGIILRVHEVAGRSGPLRVGVPGYRRAFRTDLLERDLGEVPVTGDSVEVDLHAHGFAGLRLVR